MNIQTNLTQLEIAYQTINKARLEIKATSADQRRIAGQFSLQAEQALSKVLTEMAEQIKAERDKTVMSVA